MMIGRTMKISDTRLKSHKSFGNDADEDDGGVEAHLSVGWLAKKVGAGKQDVCQNHWHMITLSPIFKFYTKLSQIAKFDISPGKSFALLANVISLNTLLQIWKRSNIQISCSIKLRFCKN